MKWMIYILVVVVIAAHYYFRHLDWWQRNESHKMNFMIEMSKTHPVFVHPIQEKE